MSFAKGVPGKPGGETSAGNNLSYPVVWAEGVTKVLRGTEGVVNTTGSFVYWWGVDVKGEEEIPLVCTPDPDDMMLCDDGVNGGPRASTRTRRMARRCARRMDRRTR